MEELKKNKEGLSWHDFIMDLNQYKVITSNSFKCKCGREYEVYWERTAEDGELPDEMNTTIRIKELK